jgi:hypothetical protein
MSVGQPRIRQNYLAITLAAIACFLLEAGWYSIFMQPWLNGIGRSREWLLGTGVNPALQYGAALLSAALVAAVISGFTQYTGAQTTLRGIKVASGLWLGGVLPIVATECVFELRTYQLFSLNVGFWLVAMAVMGAIVGGWKKKTGTGE